jgi:hypothetical protein
MALLTVNASLMERCQEKRCEREAYSLLLVGIAIEAGQSEQ